jgi:hypothetical protein
MSDMSTFRYVLNDLLDDAFLGNAASHEALPCFPAIEPGNGSDDDDGGDMIGESCK